MVATKSLHVPLPVVDVLVHDGSLDLLDVDLVRVLQELAHDLLLLLA